MQSMKRLASSHMSWSHGCISVRGRRGGGPVAGRGRGDQHRHRGLHLRLPTGHLRHGPQAADQRGHAGRRACPDGADDQDAELSGRGQPLLRRAQRRHAVHRGLARRFQRALDPQHSRHGRSLLHRADAGRLVGGVQGGGLAHNGRQGPDLRHHRSGLVGHAAEGRDAGQVSHRNGVDSRPHLLHRHARGLRGGACAAGQVLGRSAQRLRQAVHAAAGRRRSRLRHEDRRAQAGQRPGHR